MSETVHPVPFDFKARIGTAEYQALREEVAVDADAVWLDQAQRLDWTRFPYMAGDGSFVEAFFPL